MYEEAVSDSRAQVEAMSLITGTMCEMHNFSEDNRLTLRTQCTRAAMHLLRKHDQCRAIACTSHLYWPTKALARSEAIKPGILIPLTGNSDVVANGNDGIKEASNALFAAEISSYEEILNPKLLEVSLNF